MGARGGSLVTVCLPGPGVLIPAACFVSLHWARSSLGVTIALLVLSFVTNSLCLIGALINFLDIAPRYASPPPRPLAQVQGPKPVVTRMGHTVSDTGSSLIR